MQDPGGETSPRVGVGNGEFDPLPAGNGAGNGESKKTFFLEHKELPAKVK
jgi:hypothetical protein